LILDVRWLRPLALEDVSISLNAYFSENMVLCKISDKYLSSFSVKEKARNKIDACLLSLDI